MNKIKFTIQELLQLEFELNGGVNGNGNITYEGFLKQNLPAVLKYELKGLSKYLIDKVNMVKDVRENLILTYGKSDNYGNIVVNKYIDVFNEYGNKISSKYDENYINYEKEYNQLLETIEEIEYPDITMDDLRSIGHTKDDYRVLFNLIKSKTS